MILLLPSALSQGSSFFINNIIIKCWIYIDSRNFEIWVLNMMKKDVD